MALGSNCDQEKNIGKAMDMLQELFDGNVKFTRLVWTEPVGIKSDKFINCLACVYTLSNYDSINQSLKNIEYACGRNKTDKTRNIVRMDIDILMFGNEKHHDDDWSRTYIKELINEIIQP